MQELTLTTTAPDGTRLLSHVIIPDGNAVKAGIMVAPEWWGADDPHPQKVAQELAKLGFATITMDVYGEGRLTTDAGQAGEWMNDVLQNPQKLMGRCTAIYQDFIALPQVDGTRVGAVGYCFGGKIVLDMARLGTPFKAVATFHGNPTPIQPADERFVAQVLVAHGEADSMIPMSAIDGLKAELDKAGVRYDVDVYADAKHGFTNPLADKRAKDNGVDLGYHEPSAQASWDKMVGLMKSVLA